jgi:4-azaleucine resistance transporter AzlC
VADGAARAEPRLSPAEARRKLILDGLGIIVSAVGFGFVYGLAARTQAGFSPIDVMAMSVFVFAGAAQFAAIGYVVGGVPWLLIGVLTGLLNARHVLYSAALAPWFRGRPFAERAVAAHVLTDEAFALSAAHFRRLGRFDAYGYWFAAIVVTFIPWFFATLAGALLGESIVDPERLGIDVIFPAAMIGLAVGLITGRRELVAAIVGATVGVGVSLVLSPTVGIIAGGVIGPAVGLLVPSASARETAPIGSEASADRYGMPHTLVDRPAEDELE